jgi:hypothetical protein
MFELLVTVRNFQFLNNMYLLPDTICNNSSHGVVFNDNKTMSSDSLLTLVLSTFCLGI